MMTRTWLSKVKNLLRPCWLMVLQTANFIVTPLMFLVISYALLVSLFAALTPWAKIYKPQISAFINQTTQLNIEIQDIKTSWYGWYPVLKLVNVRLLSANGRALVCDECWIGLDIVRSLFYWHLHPGMLYIDGLNLHLRQQSDHWEIRGVPKIANQQQASAVSTDIFGKILSYAPERVLLKNIQLNFHPLSKKVYSFRNIRLLGLKNNGAYKWSIQSSFGHDGLFKILIDMPALTNLALPQNGKMYVELHNMDLASIPGYQQFITDNFFQRFDGTLNSHAWVEWNKGNINEIHAQVTLQDAIIQSKFAKKPMHIDNFSANSLWKQRSTGWELAMDKFNLSSDKISLTDNKLLLFFQSDWNTYHLYLQKLPIKLLSTLSMQMPANMANQAGLFTAGELSDLQLNFKDNALDYVLTQFSGLDMDSSDNRPGFNGLSGVLSWEPQTSHLEIASQNFILQPLKMAPIAFDSLQFIGTLQKNSQGQESLHFEKFVLSRDDLAVTMSGQVKEPFDNLNRNVLVQLNWSAINAHQWLKYLKLFMPKNNFSNWLENDIKRIYQTSGRMIINGLWQDFPFADKPGEFTVNSHLYAVDLFFAHDWPLSTNIDANLQLNSNKLEVLIDKGSLGKLPVQQLDLQIPNLGADKEVILVHGVIQDKVARMIDYLSHTPLQKKAHSWSIYDFKGQGLLDLKLDIPLYKERDEIFFSGKLKFDEQPMDLKVFTHPLTISYCKGYLGFNQKGLYAGNLTGRVGQDKINLHISLNPQHDETMLSIDGLIDVTELKKAWGLASYDALQGHLPLQGNIHIPSATQQIDMLWESNLQGVSLMLPKPWDKSAQDEKPLHIQMTYHDTGLINMNVLYEQKKWQIDYDNKKWSLKVAEPDLMGDILYDASLNTIDAKLSRLYLDDKIFQSNDEEKKENWSIKSMPSLMINVDDFHYNDLNVGALSLQAVKQDKKYLLQELKLSSSAFTMLVSGDWSLQQAQNHIQFAGQLMISNLSNMLEQFGMTPVAGSKDGRINFTGYWDEPLNKVALKTLTGSIDFNMKKGNISHFDSQTEQKIGLGKLLSILSLQTIPRRLRLDFSDLSASGFTYDVFKGHFDLNNGLLSTNDAQMDGPVAHVSMNGQLNVIDKWYDLELQVYPYITASLPVVVATIAGSPIAGVATWAVNQVINKGMQKVSAYTYRITGPWKEPIVQQVSLTRKTNEKNVPRND